MSEFERLARRYFGVAGLVVAFGIAMPACTAETMPTLPEAEEEDDEDEEGEEESA